MTLQCERSKRKFKLEEKRLKYINQLFSHATNFDTHLRLVNEDYLQSEECADISEKISEFLESNIIYEYITENNDLVPVVNPSDKTMFNNQLLFPISRSSVNFLSKFSEFLYSRQRINITY